MSLKFKSSQLFNTDIKYNTKLKELYFSFVQLKIIFNMSIFYMWILTIVLMKG